MSEKNLPPLLDRHWAESALAIGAVIIAAVSLWMAYDTERTNRDLVASQSWPYVRIYESDTGTDPRAMSLVISNDGIGPAKLETFEVFWKGKPLSNPWQLLQACCGRVDLAALQRDRDMGTAADEGIVVRAGETTPFLTLVRGATDSAAWDALYSAYGRNLAVRYCYCSAFDECWVNTERFNERHQMNPPRVRSCPRPQASYDNLAAATSVVPPDPSAPPPRTGRGAP